MSTFVLIEKYTVGAGGASSVTLGSGGTIPQTYTDLVVKISGRTDNTGTFANMIRFNGDTGSNYSWKNLYGYNSATYSDTLSGGSYVWGGYTNNSSLTASSFGNSEIYVPNYRASIYKSVSADGVMETNASTGVSLGLGANIWNNTAAITSITCIPYVGNYAQYSTFYLYGILKA